MKLILHFTGTTFQQRGGVENCSGADERRTSSNGTGKLRFLLAIRKLQHGG